MDSERFVAELRYGHSAEELQPDPALKLEPDELDELLRAFETTNRSSSVAPIHSSCSPG